MDMPSLYRRTLVSRPTTQACLDTVNDLTKRYKIANGGRNPTVALLCSTIFGQSKDGGKTGAPDTYAVTLSAENSEAQTAEIAWFQSEANNPSISS